MLPSDDSGGHVLRFRFSWLACELVLMIAGIWWCVEAFGRREEDLRTLRESKDRVVRRLVIGYWVVTAGVAVGVLMLCWAIVRHVARFVGT